MLAFTLDPIKRNVLMVAIKKKEKRKAIAFLPDTMTGLSFKKTTAREYTAKS